MNVYEPENSDVLEWIASASPKEWPASDWDFYVCNGRNDQLILEKANDPNLEHRVFFVHCLYHIVGDYFLWNSSNEKFRKRIDQLMACVDEASSIEVTKWLVETEDLLSAKSEFVQNYWIGFMFFDKL